jgi:predicted nucleic acid-binding protein
MIVLDTNVISEPLRPTGNPVVLAWLDRQDIETLFLAAISLAELRHGIAALPPGRRRKQLAEALEERILPLFGPRILPFDSAAASAYAEVRSRAHRAGKAVGTADSYIAATVAARGFAIATRDTSPFEAAGLNVVNPWSASSV